MRLAVRGEDDEGTSLIEMVVALVIFGILSSALLVLLLSSARLVRLSAGRTVAGQVASSVVDEARAQGATSVAPGRVVTNRTVKNVVYTVTRDAQFVSRTATTGSCTASGTPSFLRVRVAVTWAGMGSVPPIEVNTLVAPRVGDADANSGSVAVLVSDRNGAGSAGTTVTLTGRTTGTVSVQQTTADGCAYFAFRPPGTYDAALSSTDGVTPAGVSSPSQAVTVQASQTASLAMQYDRSASITLVADTDSGHPAPSSMPFTLYNTLAYTNATKTRVVAGTAPSTLVTGLFPTAAGYVVWAGSCTANDPVAQRQPPVASDPGGAVTQRVAVGRFDITPSGAGAGAPWSATFTQTDAGCPTAASYTFIQPNSGGIRGALPFGSWNLTTTSVGGTTPAIVVTLPAGSIGVTTMGAVVQ